MRQLRVLLIGCGLIVGIPGILMTTGWHPVAAVVVMWSGRLTSLEERLIGGLVLLVWACWVWVVVGIAIELWTTRSYEAVTGARSRLAALFVASLWTMLVTSRNTPATPPSEEAVVDATSSRSGSPHPWLPVASVQSALIADHMLRRAAERRASVTRNLPDGCEMAPLSRTSEFFWRSLRLRADDPNSDRVSGIPVGMDPAGRVVTANGRVEIVGASAEEEAPLHEHLVLAEEAVELDVDDVAPTVVIRDSHGWRMGTGDRIQPFGLSEDDKRSFSRLLTECSGVREVSSPARVVPGDWLMCVRLLGPVEARWADDSEVRFRKSKSLELLTWLVTHPDRPTRGAARTAMWMVDVQSSYFNNVVSDLRAVLGSDRAIGRFDLLDRTAQDRLILDERVVSDAEILRFALERFRNHVTEESRGDLRAALSLVRNLPFAGADYLWPDPEGITSNLVHLVMSASLEFAEDALNRHDVDDVYFATDKGLRMFPGDEELLTLRSSVARQVQRRPHVGRSG